MRPQSWIGERFNNIVAFSDTGSKSAACERANDADAKRGRSDERPNLGPAAFGRPYGNAIISRLSVARERSIIGTMGRLFDKVRDVVNSDRFLVSWHADERCEERGIAVWQLAAELDDATLLRERPQSRPNPSVVVGHELADGSEVEVIWAWMGKSERAKLVTVYFRD